ncbi:S-layer homology domain-containing protein [Bacillus songklensis]|uniref:S-layer homology domain-containing protein n=1 Tax=Bacillus songklensis TaxID=1069116 RepID=A0ABV8AZ23_9BACI
MNIGVKRFVPLFLALILALSIWSPASAEERGIHYVVLGDSLAAGQTPYKKWENGYADYIAHFLYKKKQLASYTKEFAVSGYTSGDLLKDIETNKQRKTATIQEEIATADIITIQVGANDFLREAKFDYANGKVTLDPEKIPSLLSQMEKNVTSTLQHITIMNPYAKVYVLGYYYPFAHMTNLEQERILRMMNSLLNSSLQGTAANNGATYISYDNLFDEHASVFLPNQSDIHPSLKGYRLMSSQFLTQSGLGGLYRDVPQSFWDASEIYYLAHNDILSGETENEFMPNQTITRAEAARALFSGMTLDIGITQEMPPDSGFKDVPQTHKDYYAIAKLTKAGVFNKSEYFYPDRPLTRAQMAKIFTLAFDLEPKQANSFKDVPASFWAKDYIHALSSNNVTTGYSDQTFKPNHFTTRAQFAAFLYRSIHIK